jgi:hypothetical protein
MNRGIRIALIAIFAILGISALFLFFFLGFGGKTNNPTTSTSTSRGFFDFLKKDKPVTIEPTPPDPDQETSTSTTKIVPTNSNLVKVTNREVSAFIPTSDGSVRFIERGTGQIFSVLGDKETLLSSRTIQRVAEAEFNKNGSALILGIYDTSGNISRKIAIIKGSSSASSTENVSFSEIGESLSLAFNPEGDQVAQLTKTNNTISLLTFSLKSPSKKTTLFSSAFSDWRLAWPEKNTITLLSKPSGLVSGSLYSVNKSTKTVSHDLGGILGLNSIVSSDAKNILYSATNNSGTFSTYLSEKATGFNMISPTRTLAEKCVWSKKETKKIYCAAPGEAPKGVYPDDWYKGKISFSDIFYILEAGSTDLEFILDPLESGTGPVDAASLTLNEKEDTLYFIDKATSSLWSLRLN